MKNEQKIFIIIVFSCALLVVNGLLINFSNHILLDSNLAVGSVLNLEARIKNWGADLLHLDEFHAKLLLRKGLPVVRVADEQLLKESNTNQIINFASKLLFDLPPSFFNSTPNIKMVAKSKAAGQLDTNQNQMQEKMRAEGRHQGEKVELDFWQTKATFNEQRIPDTKEKDKINNRIPNNNLQQESNRQKIVGIYHTHTAENYENRGYNAHAQAGDKGDIVKIGRWIKERLNQKYNISVVHSESVHDKTYDRSYIRSLQTAKKLVDNTPELDMMFDIHRDAIGSDNKKYVTTEINGQKVAKIMIVVTNNNYGLPHPNWRENFRFAKKLAAKMNIMYPGLLRKVKLISNRRYNQHVHPQTLLLEIGSANSTLSEARRAAYLLSDVIAQLMIEEN